MADKANAQEVAYLSLNEFHEFVEKGEIVEGEILGYTWAKREGAKPFPIYSIFNDAIGVTKIVGTVQLEILMHLSPGTQIRITYNGEIKKDGKALRNFTVQVPATSARAMADAMIAAGGVRQIPPPVEAVQVIDGDEDPFADSMPPHPAG